MEKYYTIKQILNNARIKFSTSGKNVSEGWIGVRCPFCNDHSDHLGIHLETLKVSCWKCGGHSLAEYLSVALKIPFQEAHELLKSIRVLKDRSVPRMNKPLDRYPSIKKEILLPKESTKEFPKLHLDYLRSRGFNPRHIIKKYDLRACYYAGTYAYRIIIPLYENGRLMTWTSRDVTGKQIPKYLAAPINESAADSTDLIYNFDNIQEGHDAFLCEGPFDVFKLGDGAFSFLGLKHSDRRFVKIIQKKINNLYIFLDSDSPGQERANKFKRDIAPFVKVCHVLKFKNEGRNNNRIFDDPGSMTLEEVAKLKLALNFK